MKSFKQWMSQRLNELSTEELKEMLKQDLTAESSDLLPVEIIEQITEILHQRESESDTCQSAPTSTAWEQLQAHLEVVDEEPKVLPFPVTETTKHYARRKKFSHKIAVVAAIVCLSLTVSVSAQVAGLNIFGWFAKWTDEIFTFERTNHQEIPDQFMDELNSFDIHDVPMPSWFPEDYSFSESHSWQTASCNTVSASYFTEDGRYCGVTVHQFLTARAMESMVVEKSAEDVIVYTKDGRTFYIMKNIDSYIAVWYDNLLVETINGDMTYDELVKIIQSIGV